MNTELLKKKVAEEAALRYCAEHSIVGIGSGSTIYHFINALTSLKIEGAIASSELTKKQLISLNIPVVSLNAVNSPPIYIDGADAVDAKFRLIKGRGGALTREKVIATASQKFICIVDQSKWIEDFSKYPCPPVPVEILPMAQAYVERQLRNLGGNPSYREGFVTDNGNKILDVHDLDLKDPLRMEYLLNQIPGVVENGIFAQRIPDIVLIADGESGIRTYAG